MLVQQWKHGVTSYSLSYKFSAQILNHGRFILTSRCMNWEALGIYSDSTADSR
jgi:hypothetical protein